VNSAIDPSRPPAGQALMKFVVLSVPYVFFSFLLNGCKISMA
jgi:hypothetical protein